MDNNLIIRESGLSGNRGLAKSVSFAAGSSSEMGYQPPACALDITNSTS
jgi:hypothetical protein